MFTNDNTDGQFNTAELAMLNRVLVDYIAAHMAADPENDLLRERVRDNGFDAITNAFRPGITEDELRSDVIA